MQRNWIGRSEGARVKFPLESEPGDPDRRIDAIEVFTTRIDTIFGATFVLLGPEHPLVARFAERSADPAALQAAGAGVPAAGPRGAHQRRDREAGLRHRRPRDQPVHRAAGADLGRQLRARRVRHRRGHGRAGARPARLRVRAQVQPADPRRRHAGWQAGVAPTRMTEAGDAYGTLVDSGEFSGLRVGRRAEDG